VALNDLAKHSMTRSVVRLSATAELVVESTVDTRQTDKPTDGQGVRHNAAS